jgi:hypothetical protein
LGIESKRVMPQVYAATHEVYAQTHELAAGFPLKLVLFHGSLIAGIEEGVSLTVRLGGVCLTVRIAEQRKHPSIIEKPMSESGV